MLLPANFYQTEYKQQFTWKQVKEKQSDTKNVPLGNQTDDKTQQVKSESPKLSENQKPSQIDAKSQKSEISGITAKQRYSEMGVQTSPILSFSTTQSSSIKPALKDSSTSPIKNESLEQPKTASQEKKPKAQVLPAPKSPETIKPFVPTAKPTGIMAPFGNGNTNPIVPEHLLKTFNARAPKDQFEYEELNPNRPKPDPTKWIDPSEALKQYLEAKRLVDKLASRFKTEYHSKFLDWTKKIDDQTELPKKEVNNRVDQVPAGMPSGYDLERKPHRTRFAELAPQPTTQNDEATIVKVSKGKEPVDYVQVQSIYKSLKPAGLGSGDDTWKEKRHYPPLSTLKDAVNPRKGLALAEELLERAKR